MTSIPYKMKQTNSDADKPQAHTTLLTGQKKIYAITINKTVLF